MGAYRLHKWGQQPVLTKSDHSIKAFETIGLMNAKLIRLAEASFPEYFVEPHKNVICHNGVCVKRDHRGQGILKFIAEATEYQGIAMGCSLFASPIAAPDAMYIAKKSGCETLSSISYLDKECPALSVEQYAKREELF